MNLRCGRMGRAAVRLRDIMHSYKKKGRTAMPPALFFVPFVIFVLVDDQSRTAIERQLRLL